MSHYICQLFYTDEIREIIINTLNSFELSSKEYIDKISITQYNILYNAINDRYIFTNNIELESIEHNYNVNYKNITYTAQAPELTPTDLKINKRLNNTYAASACLSIETLTHADNIHVKAVLLNIYIIDINHVYKKEDNFVSIRANDILNWVSKCHDDFTLFNFYNMTNRDMLRCLYFFGAHVLTNNLFGIIQKIHIPDDEIITTSRHQTWDERLKNSNALIIGASCGTYARDIWQWSKLDINYIGLGHNYVPDGDYELDNTNKLDFMWDVENINKNKDTIKLLANKFNIVVIDHGTWRHLFDNLQQDNKSILSFINNIIIPPLKDDGILLISNRNIVGSSVYTLKSLTNKINLCKYDELIATAHIRYIQNTTLLNIVNNLTLLGYITKNDIENDTKKFYVYIKNNAKLTNANIRKNIIYLEEHFKCPLFLY